MSCVQGLVPLSLRSILVARLVCKHWQQSVGCLISKLSIPYEVWTCQSSHASTRVSLSVPATGNHAGSEYVTPDTLSDVEADDDAQDVGLQEDDDIWIPPPAVLSYVSAAAAAATAAAVAAAKERAAASQKKRRHEQVMNKQQQHEQAQQGQHQPKRRNRRPPQQEQPAAVTDAAAAQAAPATSPMAGGSHAGHSEVAEPVSCTNSKADAEAGSGGDGSDALATEQVPAAAVDQQTSMVHVIRGQDPSVPSSTAAGVDAGHLEHLATVNGIALQSSAANPQTTPTVQAAAAAPEAAEGTAVPAARPENILLGQTQQALQHPLQRLHVRFPFCKEVTLCCLNRSTSNPPVHQQGLITQSLGFIGQLPRLNTLILQGSLPTGTWLQVVRAMQQQQQLQQKLRCLQLIGVDLPQPDVLESVVELGGLRDLVLHANDKSHGLQVCRVSSYSFCKHCVCVVSA